MIVCKNCGCSNEDSALVCAVCEADLETGNEFNDRTSTLELFEIGMRTTTTINSQNKPCTLADNEIEFKYENGNWYITSEKCRIYIDQRPIHKQGIIPNRAYISVFNSSDERIYAFTSKVIKCKTKESSIEADICPFCGMSAVKDGKCTYCKRQVT